MWVSFLPGTKKDTFRYFLRLIEGLGFIGRKLYGLSLPLHLKKGLLPEVLEDFPLESP